MPQSWFEGLYEYRIDSKGRVFIPAVFRKPFENQKAIRFKVTRGYEGCLFVLPLENWSLFVKELSKHSIHGAEQRSVSRQLYGFTKECVLDEQGRITIPQHLLQHAGITKEVVIVGVGERFELWSKERWEAYLKQEEANFEERAQELARFKAE